MSPESDPEVASNGSEVESEEESELEEHQQVRDIESPHPKISSVTDAINSAPIDLIRQILISLCDTHPYAQEAVEQALLVSINAGGGKRKAFETCKNCDEEFGVLSNSGTACLYHDSEKAVDFDSSTWDDHDPNVHGEYDDHADDEDFADGFVWTCCDSKGSVAGCIYSKHEAEETVKRQRL